jgi:TBC1 domain family member 2
MPLLALCSLNCDYILIAITSTYDGVEDSDPSSFDPALLSPTALNALEADCFWCLSKLLDGIQDNYISGQPGIHRSVKYLSGLVGRVDRTSIISLNEPRPNPQLYHPFSMRSCLLTIAFIAPLAKHFQSQNVEFMQFAFRWMNCLLMRELSVKNTIRMWDTYLVRVATSRHALINS